MTTVDIYQDNPLYARPITVKPDDSSNQVKRIMGENEITLSFQDSRYLAFKIGDYCDVYGERYQVSKLPVFTKISRFLYKYTLNMKSIGYDLSKAQYLFLGADNSLRESEFSLMGTAEDFLDLVIANANRVGSGWIKGQCITTEHKNLSFSKDNCYNILSRLAEEFETEWWIDNKTVHLVKMANDTGHTYKHGRNRGLYEITRQNLNDSDVVTRLYAYGSEKNLPPTYPSKRLRFPGGYNPCLISNLTCTLVDNGDGTQTFTFSWTPPLSTGVTDVSIEYRAAGSNDPWQFQLGVPASSRSITLPNGNYEFRFRTYGSTCSGPIAGTGIPTAVVVITASIITPIFVYRPLPFLERNINVYGVIEDTSIFDDIYPHRTGVVSAVDGTDPFVFTDIAIPFDVNAQLLPGLTPKVTFNTGQLAGYTFDIESFNNSTKQFRVQKNGDERTLDIPSTTFRPAIGDKYVITDIEMPTIYVTDAETELKNKAEALLIQLSEPQLQYSITFDPTFLKRINRTLNIGDLIWIVDAELDLQRKIRVVTVTRNILNEFQFTVELADVIAASTITRLISSVQSNDRNVRDIDHQLVNNSILNNNVIGTLTFPNMPSTSTMTGFLNVVIEISTGKLYKKV
jgi:hypothetical protein